MLNMVTTVPCGDRKGVTMIDLFETQSRIFCSTCRNPVMSAKLNQLVPNSPPLFSLDVHSDACLTDYFLFFERLFD